MTSISLPALGTPTRPRPSWLRLVAIQFALIARSGRWIELIGGAATLYVLALFGPAMNADLATDARAWGQWAIYCMALVAIWPSLLWRGEPLGRRHYHWSLPVSHGSHDLARIAAGGLWLFVLLAMVALTNYIVIWPLSLRPDAQSMSEIIEYAVGLMTLYCVASVFTLVVAHPARWFVGSLTIYLLLWAPLTLDVAHGRAYRAWAAPIIGPYGLFWATIGAGSTGDASREVTANTITTSDGDRVTVTVKTVDTTTKAPGKPGSEPRVELLEFRGPHWRWAASALWLAGSIGAMLLIAVRRRER